MISVWFLIQKYYFMPVLVICWIPLLFVIILSKMFNCSPNWSICFFLSPSVRARQLFVALLTLVLHSCTLHYGLWPFRPISRRFQLLGGDVYIFIPNTTTTKCRYFFRHYFIARCFTVYFNINAIYSVTIYLFIYL